MIQKVVITFTGKRNPHYKYSDVFIQSVISGFGYLKLHEANILALQENRVQFCYSAYPHNM